METRILPADNEHALRYAVDLIQKGEVVAFPTDTVYGVGADAFNARAIEQLFAVKNRPRERAIPILIASMDDLPLVAREISADARMLAGKFWPGALTLVVPAVARIPKILISGGESVAVRVPNHPTTRALIQSLRAPLAATSANISSQPDPATAEQVLAYLSERIPLILDGGPTPGNVPSTVVDVTTDPPTVRRTGVIAPEEIEVVLGKQLK